MKSVEILRSFAFLSMALTIVLLIFTAFSSCRIGCFWPDVRSVNRKKIMGLNNDFVKMSKFKKQNFDAKWFVSTSKGITHYGYINSKQ